MLQELRLVWEQYGEENEQHAAQQAIAWQGGRVEDDDVDAKDDDDYATCRRRAQQLQKCSLIEYSFFFQIEKGTSFFSVSEMRYVELSTYVLSFKVFY